MTLTFTQGHHCISKTKLTKALICTLTVLSRKIALKLGMMVDLNMGYRRFDERKSLRTTIMQSESFLQLKSTQNVHKSEKYNLILLFRLNVKKLLLQCIITRVQEQWVCIDLVTGHAMGVSCQAVDENLFGELSEHDGETNQLLSQDPHACLMQFACAMVFFLTCTTKCH